MQQQISGGGLQKSSGVKDGFPGEEAAIHGEGEGVGGSQAEQQQTELDKVKGRETSWPLLENST